LLNLEEKGLISVMIQLDLSAVISVVVRIKCEDLSWPVCSMSHNSFRKHWKLIIFVMNVVCDRLLQKPFLVNAQIRVQEDHLNARSFNSSPCILKVG
jgi:hypothetical protein